MTEFINTIDILGDEGLTDAIITKSLPEEFNDDVIKKIGYESFAYNNALKKINVPSLITFVQSAVRGSTALETVVAPSVTTIEHNVFNGCTSLKAMIMPGETVCSLGNVNTFTSTPIASGTGYIYVPAALVDSYKATTNWSTYADQFRALEDYTVDGTTTGELDETKI